MTAQAFGDDLRRYLDQYSRATLASKMFSDGRFGPLGVDSPDDIERVLRDTEAGRPWPYSQTDFTHFLEVVVGCGPVRPAKTLVSLRWSGAIYSTELDP